MNKQETIQLVNEARAQFRAALNTLEKLDNQVTDEDLKRRLTRVLTNTEVEHVVLRHIFTDIRIREYDDGFDSQEGDT